MGSKWQRAKGKGQASNVLRLVSCVLGLLLLALAGCGQPAAEGRVTFMVFGDPAEVAAYEALVAAFEDAHPDIDVELSYVADQGEYRQRLAAAFSARNAPDVMLLNYRRFATFAGEGGLEPLGDYLAQSERLDEAAFYPTAIESFHYAGQLWCIPQNLSSLVIYYNRDLFDAAGLPYPQAGWTWDEFLATAQSLTRDLDGDGVIDQYGVGVTPNLFRLAPFIWQNGGVLVDDQERPTRLTLDSPAALEAFQWFVDLQVRHHVAPDAVAESAESGERRFQHGRLAMYFNSRRGVPTYRTIESFAWDVAPLPQRQQAAGILHSDGYCMAATAADKAAAWTFIEFANAAEGQTLIAATGRTVPSLRAVAESPAFLTPDLAPANSRAFLDDLGALGRVPTTATWAWIEEVASREIERAFYGQATVAEAAAEAIARTQSYFEN